jgi:ATP-dependent DNA helicase RecG
MLDRLVKILNLEVEQGYRDRAVIGGLERLADHWEREMAHQPGESAGSVAEMAALLRAYKSLDNRAARQAHIAHMQAVLDRLSKMLPASPAGEEARAGAPPGEAEPTLPPRADRPEPEAAPVRPGPQISRQDKSKGRMVERLGLDAPVTVLSGVNVGYADKFSRLGVTTIRDLLQLFPRRYDDFRRLKLISQLEYGEEVTIIATVWEASLRRTRGGAQMVQAVMSDDSGTIQCTWFNQTYLLDKLARGRQIVISGKVDEYMGRLTFQNPEWEPLDKELLHTARLVPIYPLTEGITNKWLRRLMKNTVDYWAPRITDYLPRSVVEPARLADLNTALRQIHFPDDWDDLERARRRLAFDELFLIQMGVMIQKQAWRAEPGRALEFDPAAVEQFLAGLPYQLTGAQQRALNEILADIRTPVPMNRLLQGDVGSGKTVVAAAAAWAAVAVGVQVALMAPTEILAEQHFKTLTNILNNGERSTVNVRLLTGSTPDEDRQRIYAELADGAAHIVVGTHALIQPNVTFRDLALVIIDEQHRFGVQQRAALRQKGYMPHMLVMTATPIPRTLALTLYGDLDLSIIDEMPPGRQKIETHWLFPTERERAYNFIRAQVDQGHQAFVICPLVEESEKLKARDMEVKAAVEEYERLKKEVFPNLKLGLLHGRMKGEEKEATMGQFARGELDVLVSTSVVEVGIDVPNATVMLVEGANRFGLSQLHQFRGRVGRGPAPAYCLLLADSGNVASDERLKAIEATDDGFKLAEKDLELRGPGEFFGTRQSGLPDLRLAQLTDVKLLELARAQAENLFNADPGVKSPENKLLAERVARFWSGEGDVS